MIYQPVPPKHCYACDKFYPGNSEYFSINRTKKDGLRTECKLCHRTSVRKYNKEHPDTRKASRERYNAKHPEKLPERVRRCRAKHQEQYNESSRKSHHKNKHKHVESNKLWRHNNPEKIKAIKNNRRARELAAEGSFRGEDINRQYKAQKGKCYWCNKRVGKRYHIDHVIPLSRGGTNWPSNLVIACPACNESKHDKMPHEWGKGLL